LLEDTATAPQPQEIQTSGLADQVYQGILSGIQNGAYAPNSRLPSEHQLASQFDVSRPVVRTALARLKRENVIVSRQGAGSFVRPPATQPPLGFAPVENIADIQRCYEYRLTLEPEAAAFAAQRHNEEALARIDAALETLAQATRQGVHRDDVDFAFHLAIAEASNNHYYHQSMLALQPHIAVGMHIHGISLMGPKQGLDYVLEEHRRIVEAIRARQPDDARALMSAHLRSSRDRLFEGRLLDLSLR
jgi:GntR family transcriptional repressor for pyruvate dehydrogenase complex